MTCGPPKPPTVRERFPEYFHQKSGFVFGKKSQNSLKGVNPYLVKVTERALQLSPVDFTVNEGLRSESRQKVLVARGVSTTLDSKHLTGDAVDLVPYIDGKLKWDWDSCYEIASAMAIAELVIAEEEGVKGRGLIRWGGVWDSRLTLLLDDYSNENLSAAQTMKRQVAKYSDRFRQQYQRTPFLDGVHFECAEARDRHINP